MYEAGGRLFVDVTRELGTPAVRDGLLAMLAASDPLIGDALATLVARDFVPPAAPEDPAGPGSGPGSGRVPGPPPPSPIPTDPAVVAALVERNEAWVAALQREIATRSGQELLDVIAADLAEPQRL